MCGSVGAASTGVLRGLTRRLQDASALSVGILWASMRASVPYSTHVCSIITRHATRSPEDHPTPTGQPCVCPRGGCADGQAASLGKMRTHALSGDSRHGGARVAPYSTASNDVLPQPVACIRVRPNFNGAMQLLRCQRGQSARATRAPARGGRGRCDHGSAAQGHTVLEV